MRIPYIRINQRGEIFFFSKVNALELKPKINFHFRDPYRAFGVDSSIEDTAAYISRLHRKGLDVASDPKGIQRRLQSYRIRDIAKYVQASVANFFPNSIILSANVSGLQGFEELFQKYEENEIGYFDLPDDMKFGIIDGQHRLAGLFSCPDSVVAGFDLPVVLLFNVSLASAAKLFSDINGNQKPVNRSLIYDLQEEIKAEDMEDIKAFHTIAQKFYIDERSPLYKQIKMLGIGKGAISQAFFIDYSMDAVKKTALKGCQLQEVYNHLYFYFKAFQETFPEDWPVPVNFGTESELETHANKVLIERRSQLAKTNGFGAILRLFPDVYSLVNNTPKAYSSWISKLAGNIEWVEAPDSPQGTGKKFQDSLYEKMRAILGV